MSADPLPKSSVNRQIFAGTIWTIAARWGIRGIGLVSTVILARLLTPADFGIVAMAMLLVVAIEVFGATGLALYIIRHPDPGPSHLNTVFTLRLLIGIALGLLMLLMSRPGAWFFNEPRVVPVICVLAIRPVMQGLENPGTILFRKHLVFRKDFEFLVLNKLVSFAVTVSLAVALRSYWALVIGIVAGGFISTAQSYRMHPYRPRFSVAQFHDCWRFSSNILGQNFLSFINQRLDELLIGRFRSAAEMGTYSVAADIATAPVQEVVAPMQRAVLPGFAKLAHDRPAMLRLYTRSLSAVAIIALSAGVGIALVAADYVAVALGAKWDYAVPIVRLLAISGTLGAISQPMLNMMIVTGHERAATRITALALVLSVAALLPAAAWFRLPDVALARMLVGVVVLWASMAMFSSRTGIPFAAAASVLLRPAVAAAAMAAVVLAIQNLAGAPSLPRLLLTAGLGAATFLSTLLGLWHLAGRPDALEGDLLSVVRDRWRRVRYR